MDCFARMIEAAKPPTPLRESVEVSAVASSLVIIAMFGASAFGSILFRLGAQRARWRRLFAGLSIWSAATLIAGIVATVRGELVEAGFAAILFLTSAGIWARVVVHKRRLAALRAAMRTG
jgi:hypothetical protein